MKLSKHTKYIIGMILVLFPTVGMILIGLAILLSTAGWIGLIVMMMCISIVLGVYLVENNS